MKKGYVYILHSQRNGRYYIGSTNDVERRFHEHSIGHVKATRYIRPLVLVCSVECSNLQEARRKESWLKRHKSRILLEKIIKDKVILGP